MRRHDAFICTVLDTFKPREGPGMRWVILQHRGHQYARIQKYPHALRRVDLKPASKREKPSSRDSARIPLTVSSSIF